MKKTTKTLLAGTVGVAGAMLATTATANADTVHKVVANDTVSGLAQKYGVSIQSIEQLNNINKQTGMIYQGQDLQIPTKNANENNVQNYTVQSGDSLWAIANKFGMTVSQLQKMNNIPANDTLIHPGQILKINGHAVVVAATPASTQQETAQQPVANQQQATVNNNQAQQLANAVAAQKAAAAQQQAQQAQQQQQQAQQKTVPANVQQQVNAAKASLDDANAKLSSAQSNLIRIKAETANASSSSQSAASTSVATPAPTAQANYAAQQSSSVQQSAQQTSTTAQPQQQVKPAAVAQVSAQTQPTQQNNNNTDASAAHSAAVQQAQQQVNQAQQQVNQAQANYNAIVSYAESFIGTPYVWGGTTPAGFDCSGFTQYVYAHEGIQIGRVTTQQEITGTQISVSQAQPGDLLFWGPKGATYHVGIYVGDGKFIAAPEPGMSVSIQSMQGFEPSFAVHVQ